ncbi:MAG: hypothetical protein LBC39_03730 [Methanobrevibacter sp.]|nr:hypothetical protein [Candidatus Methanovirga aequatorialis]
MYVDEFLKTPKWKDYEPSWKPPSARSRKWYNFFGWLFIVLNLFVKWLGLF